jgi:hypothetical protein
VCALLVLPEGFIGMKVLEVRLLKLVYLLPVYDPADRKTYYE